MNNSKKMTQSASIKTNRVIHCVNFNAAADKQTRNPKISLLFFVQIASSLYFGSRLSVDDAGVVHKKKETSLYTVGTTIEKKGKKEKKRIKIRKVTHIWTCGV